MKATSCILVKSMFLSDSRTMKGDTYCFLKMEIPDTYQAALRENVYAENLQIKIHRLQNLIRNSLTEIEGDFISIMTTMNLKIPEQLLSQLACC